MGIPGLVKNMVVLWDFIVILLGFYTDSMGYEWDIPSGKRLQFANLNMAIEIVSFPMKHGEFPVRYVNVYQRVVMF